MSYTERELFEACAEASANRLDVYLDLVRERSGETKALELKAKVEEVIVALDSVPYPPAPATREQMQANVRDAMRVKYPEFGDDFIEGLGRWGVVRIG